MKFEDRLGTVVGGKWTLERLLGAGGMAAVYVGLHKIGRRDAIKVLHPEVARVPELRARFDQEAYAVNRFSHPGVVEIRDVEVTDDGCPCLVMELLEGESLAERCSRAGPPETAEALRIADELLDVLVAAHARHIIHRDIKPDNLFCLNDGRIKVLDFGVARVRQVARQMHTQTGATLGTLTYMPPEQVKGEDIDVRADVFAVGATLFRMLAQRRIHDAPSDAALLLKMATEPAPALASAAPHLPRELCAVVDHALAFDREDRYPSAEAMQQDVRALREGRPPLLAKGPPAARLPSGGDGPEAGAARAATAGDPAATRVDLDGALAAPVPAPVPVSTPFQVAAAEVTRWTSQATRWTVTTVGEKRFRRVAFAAPIAGAVLLGLIFYLATHLGVEESAERRRLAGAEGERLERADERRAGDPGAQPFSTAAAAPDSCLAEDDCGSQCEHDCTARCTDRDGCTVGAAPGVTVHCTGSGPCEVSCAGDCEVTCEHECLVRCAPGFPCELEGCPTAVDWCSPFIAICGGRCP